VPCRPGPPLFATPRFGRPSRAQAAPPIVTPQEPAIADARQLDLRPGRSWRTRVAGIFLFLPLLARLSFDQSVHQAGYPGSRMVPAVSALLSRLALKLLDQERRCPINDFNFAEALGLFAGLNILPKATFATDYSYRTERRHQQQLLTGWISGLAPLLFPKPRAFALDFHPIPFRGDPTALDNHYLPRRGEAGPSVLSSFAQEHESRVLCYANTNLTRSDQAGELMRSVEFWHGITGQAPQWLYFDSKVVPYPELSRVNQRGVWFVTIRRRGAAVLRRLAALPPQAWQSAVIDTPKRCHQRVRYVDERLKLPGYEGMIRQVAIAGLGREQPTLLLSNDLAESGRALLVRYAGRNRVEDGLGTGVNFFHLDCLSSEVRLNVAVDVALTVLANGCYRWLGRNLHGFNKAGPKQLYRKFVETGGGVEVQSRRVVVRFEKRSHNPILREAGLDRDAHSVPWLEGLPVKFEYS
jgi:hypothetical protein